MKKLLLITSALIPALALAQPVPYSPGPGPTPSIPAGQAVGGVTVANLVCDGVTDNQTILQTALTAAAANNAKTVYIPPAALACMLASNVTVPGGVTVWATPGTVTLKAKAGNTSSPLLLAVSTASNITVYGLTLDGGGTSFASHNNAITVFTADHVIFDHVTIQNASGIGLIFSTSVTFSGIRDSVIANVGIGGSAQGVSFCCGTAANNHDNFASGNSFNTIGLDGLSISAQHNFVATDNRFVSAGSAFGAASLYAANNDALTIVGNSSTGASGNGIDTASNTDVVITGNTSKFSGSSGIAVGYSTNVVVVGNAANDNNKAAGGNDGGLFLSGVTTPLSNVTVAGNTFSDDQGSPTQPFGIYQQSGGTVTGVYVAKSNIGTGNTSAFFGGTIYTYSDPYQNLYTTGASVGNGSDLTEDLLQTFTVPANTLLANGDKLHVVAGGSFGATTDAKTVRVRFNGVGGTVLSAPLGSAGGQVAWSVDIWIVKTGASTFTLRSLGTVLNAATNGTQNSTGNLQNLATALAMVVTGQNVTNSVAGSVTCSYFQVDLVKAP